MPKIRLAELAEALLATVVGNPDLLIEGVNTLDEAGPSDLSFLANPRYLDSMRKSQAGAICVDATVQQIPGKTYLVCENPSAAFQKAIELLIPVDHSFGFADIHPTAIIHPTAKIGQRVSIGPYSVIERNCSVGDGTQIASHVSLYPEATLGSHCFIHSHCTIRERTKIGNRVILQPGAVIGSCGFGYTQDKFGRHTKLEQLGIVILEDDVEIGANTTIDRSRFKATIIRRGTKIDNLVQIAHNVEIGEHNAIASQTGVAGSSKTGKHVMLGGQVGIAGHIELADQVLVGAQSGVSKSLPSGKYRGTPALPLSDYGRHEVHLRRIKEYADRLKALEEKFSSQ